MKLSAILALLSVGLVTAGPVAKRAGGSDMDNDDANLDVATVPLDSRQFSPDDLSLSHSPSEEDPDSLFNSGIVPVPPPNPNLPQPIPLNEAGGGGDAGGDSIYFPQD